MVVLPVIQRQLQGIKTDLKSLSKLIFKELNMTKIIIKTKKTFRDITDKERDIKEIKSFLIRINNRIIDTDKRTIIKNVFKDMILNNELSLEDLLNTEIQIYLYTLWFFHSESIKVKDLFTIKEC